MSLEGKTINELSKTETLKDDTKFVVDNGASEANYLLFSKIKSIILGIIDSLKVSKAGDTMTGPLVTTSAITTSTSSIGNGSDSVGYIAIAPRNTDLTNGLQIRQLSNGTAEIYSESGQGYSKRLLWDVSDKKWKSGPYNILLSSDKDVANGIASLDSNGKIPAEQMPISSTGGKSVGEVFFSQSASATDNPGALPLWTGEYYANASSLYPDFYSWVKSHTELCKTKQQYDDAVNTYGECPYYVTD